jgi:GNAT superfamily N-acetyltransferase
LNATLRPATVADAPAVADVLQESRRAFIPYAPSAHSESEIHRWVRDSLIPCGAVTVACAGSRVVGVLATSSKPGSGWIDQLYLMPDSVRQGIGTRLLEHALCELPRPVRLYTFQANAGARSFYERNGFVAVQFSNGSSNEENCPDVLYQLSTSADNVA